MIALPIERILAVPEADTRLQHRVIGRSRAGRDLVGYSFGEGSIGVSLIAGCHADEPVGPAMLRRLARFLAGLEGSSPLLEKVRWRIVPDVNPDGAARNAAWSRRTLPTRDFRSAEDRAYDPVPYVRHAVRELPGDDIEFGFPRHADDLEARPENRAVAAFLSASAPLHLHGSLHGMGFAPGPWFLIEPEWIDRTVGLRRALRARVRSMGYPLFDLDRKGEKGFHRIDEGFATRPDSRAMQAHFLERGDAVTAAKFRPSSMELVRGLGGDPLTLVTEMPLFLLPAESAASEVPVWRAGTAGKRAMQDWLGRVVASRGPEAARREASRAGIRPMPIRDQLRLQLAFLAEALSCVASHQARGVR